MPPATEMGRVVWYWAAVVGGSSRWDLHPAGLEPASRRCIERTHNGNPVAEPVNPTLDASDEFCMLAAGMEQKQVGSVSLGPRGMLLGRHTRRIFRRGSQWPSRMRQAQAPRLWRPSSDPRIRYGPEWVVLVSDGPCRETGRQPVMDAMDPWGGGDCPGMPQPRATVRRLQGPAPDGPGVLSGLYYDTTTG